MKSIRFTEKLLDRNRSMTGKHSSVLSYNCIIMEGKLDQLLEETPFDRNELKSLVNLGNTDETESNSELLEVKKKKIMNSKHKILKYSENEKFSA